MEWRIWIESESVPADAWSDRVDALLEGLAKVPAVRGPVGWGAGTTLGAVFVIEHDSAVEAMTIGAQLFTVELAAACAGLGYVPQIRRLEVSGADFEPVDLLGASDVARLLGFSRQRVYQLLRSDPSFPHPGTHLARGALWDRHELEAWRDLREARARGSSPTRR